MLARLQVGERLVHTMGIDAVHGLAEAVFDHETEDQSLDVLAHFDLHLQHHRVTDFRHFHRAALRVKQSHAENAGFTRA